MQKYYTENTMPIVIYICLHLTSTSRHPPHNALVYPIVKVNRNNMTCMDKIIAHLFAEAVASGIIM